MSPKRTGKIDKELKTFPYIIQTPGADDDIDLLKSFLEKNALTSADFASFLKIMLETVPYPYASENRRPPKPTMHYLATLNAEDVLFERSVIDELYQAVKQNEAKTLTRNFFKDSSQDDQPRTNLRKKLRFYEEVREEVFSHIQRVRDLQKKYPGDDEWTGFYLLSLSQQMLRLNAMLTGHHFGSLVNRGKVESVRQQDYMLIKQVYSTVKKSFKQRGINNDELAYHLTAIVCTWPRPGGWLSRNPKSIGRHVRRHRLDNSTK